MNFPHATVRITQNFNIEIVKKQVSRTWQVKVRFVHFVFVFRKVHRSTVQVSLYFLNTIDVFAWPYFNMSRSLSRNSAISRESAVSVFWSDQLNVSWNMYCINDLCIWVIQQTDNYKTKLEMAYIFVQVVRKSYSQHCN